jgi:hypothetical protein
MENLLSAVNEMKKRQHPQAGIKAFGLPLEETS